MRYMFLIYSRETDMAGRSAAEMEQLKAAHWAVMDETRAKGIFHGAEPLHPTATPRLCSWPLARARRSPCSTIPTPTQRRERPRPKECG